jgi:hypothetical protein
MPDTWRTQQGSADEFTAQLRGEDDLPYTSYTGAESITTVVSVADGQPEIANVASSTWLSAAAGTITVAITGTSTMEPGTYLLALKIASTVVFYASLSISAKPATTATRTAKITLSQLKKFAPWLEKLLGKMDDPTALEARADAWDWFQDILHRHWRGSSNLSLDFHFVPGISFGGDTGFIYRDGRRSRDLQDWLDDDRLDYTTPVINAMCAYAVAQLCTAQVAPGVDNSYGEFAKEFHQTANSLAMTITAELDSDDDGVNDTTIRLGVADTLDG